MRAERFRPVVGEKTATGGFQYAEIAHGHSIQAIQMGFAGSCVFVARVVRFLTNSSIAATVPASHVMRIEVFRNSLRLVASSKKIVLTLPDGARRNYSSPITGAEVAADIGPGLASAALACTIDGALSDLSLPIERDARFSVVTMSNQAEALELLRHDCAHVLARAVQELWPDTKVTIGPVIENGFYYDFDREEPFTQDDFAPIEARMREIIALDEEIRRESWTRGATLRYYEQSNEPFKMELVNAIPEGEEIRMYYHGPWLDLCRGPHLFRVGQIPPNCFQLTTVAGAYWRGDSSRQMLQRIYGTAWRTGKELASYLEFLEEARRRDHRALGRKLSLFHIQEEAPGMVFWHPNGWRIWRALEDYMRRRLDAADYVEVRTPEVVDRKLWERSGHWEKFREHMFITEIDEEHAAAKRVNALKPMNCPCHVQIFNRGLKSYRDLPLRMAEFGSCHRYEPSGAMHGLMRVRGFTQDDAHIFCTGEQIASETKAFIELLSSIYADLGFPEFTINYADRPPIRAGSDEVWTNAEQSLLDATKSAGCDFKENPGEGAFYGPKLEFVLTDAIGREWQCGTLQVDFVLPERLEADYVATDGQKRRAVMLHRAILGSFERFIGILVESSAGRLPMWMAPRQVVVATVVSDANEYAREVVRLLRGVGLRAECDLRNEKINYKVREHSTGLVPFILAVGRREVGDRTVSIRRLGERLTKCVALDAALDMLTMEALPPDLMRARGEAE